MQVAQVVPEAQLLEGMRPVVEEGLQQEDPADENDDGDEEPLPAIMGQNDPRRMELTKEELDWADAIKDCIEAMPDLDNLSDFMYAQLAIICEDDVTDAIERAFGLQIFREEYKIYDTREDGQRQMRNLLKLFPEQFLSFSFSQNDGTYVIIHDATKMNTTCLTTAEKINDWFAACYYIHTSMSPDLESVRKGCISCVECEGFDWTMKQDFKLMHKMFFELLTCYPFRGQIKHFHTGMIINLIVATFRKILPPHLKDKLLVGLSFDCRLDQAFLVPTAAAANKRMLTKIDEALKRRYDNESTFSLSNNN